MSILTTDDVFSDELMTVIECIKRKRLNRIIICDSTFFFYHSGGQRGIRIFIKPCFRLYIAFCFFVWNTCMEWVFDWCNTILLFEFNFNIIINNTIGLLQTPSTISTDITSKSIIKESPLFATFQMIKNHVFETLFECAIRLRSIEII